jgi:hypothetical protein
MSNQFLTTSLISKTALAMFSVNAPYVMTASRIYQPEFSNTGYKIGSQIQMKRQLQYIIGDGSVAEPQNITETVETLTINHQYHALVAYTIQDLTLKIDDFSRIFLQPAIQRIIAKMETDISKAAELQLNYYTGTAGTPINSFTTVDLAGAKLLEQGVDISDDTYLATTVRDGSSLKSGLQGNFTPVFNEEIVRRSAIGHISYFDVFQSQCITKHTAGAGPTLHSTDTLTVNGAVSSGNTLVLAGANGGGAAVSGYFLPGDLISFSSTAVQNVNPETQLGTGQGAQFVVTAAADSAIGGAISVQVAIAGTSIISDPTNPLQNVSNPIPDGAAVIVVPSYNTNVAYPARALDIVCPPLMKLQVPYCSVAVDPTTKLSMTVTQIGDITNYLNYMRIDLLCGFLWHPQYAVKVLS